MRGNIPGMARTSGNPVALPLRNRRSIWTENHDRDEDWVVMSGPCSGVRQIPVAAVTGLYARRANLDARLPGPPSTSEISSKILSKTTC
jgi:hypothetical protein